MPIRSELSQILGKGKRLLPYIISYTPFYSDHLNFLTKTVLNFLIIPQKMKSEELFNKNLSFPRPQFRSPLYFLSTH